MVTMLGKLGLGNGGWGTVDGGWGTVPGRASMIEHPALIKSGPERMAQVDMYTHSAHSCCKLRNFSKREKPLAIATGSLTINIAI